MTRYALLPMLLLILAACDKNAPVETEADAVGQVLPGTISDEMLPLDTVRSQAPVLPASPDYSGAGDGDVTLDGPSDALDAVKPDSDASAAPEASDDAATAAEEG